MDYKLIALIHGLHIDSTEVMHACDVTKILCSKTEILKSTCTYSQEILLN